MAHRQEPKRKAPTLDKYIKIEWKFERKKKEKTFERTFRSKARIKNSISLSPIFSPSPSFPFFFSFFIKTQSLKISLAIQRNAEGINKPDNVGAFCKSESGRSGIIQVGRTRGNEEKRDQPRTSWMKGDGGASIDAAKLFNGQVELPRAPFFSLPCFLFPFTGVCAPLFIPFSLFFFFFLIFFPSFLFIRERGWRWPRMRAFDAHVAVARSIGNSSLRHRHNRLCCQPVTTRLEPRHEGSFRDFESLLSLSVLPDPYFDGRKSREPVNGFNLELAAVSVVSFQISKDLQFRTR